MNTQEIQNLNVGDKVFCKNPLQGGIFGPVTVKSMKDSDLGKCITLIDNRGEYAVSPELIVSQDDFILSKQIIAFRDYFGPILKSDLTDEELKPYLKTFSEVLMDITETDKKQLEDRVKDLEDQLKEANHLKDVYCKHADENWNEFEKLKEEIGKVTYWVWENR